MRQVQFQIISHGSGREVVPASGALRRRPGRRRRRSEGVVRERRRRSVGGAGRVGGRAGAVERRGADEAGAGGVGQGRGVHGRQGIDARLNRQGIQHFVGGSGGAERVNFRVEASSSAARARGCPCCLIPDRVCLLDRLPIGLYMVTWLFFCFSKKRMEENLAR